MCVLESFFLQFDVTGRQQKCMTAFTAYVHVQNTIIQNAFFSVFWNSPQNTFLQVKLGIIHLVNQSVHWNHHLKLAVKDLLKDDENVSFV